MAQGEAHSRTEAAFAAMDTNNDNVLSLDEYKGTLLGDAAPGAGAAKMYEGPRFQGEASVPIDAELECLDKRIQSQKDCKSLMLYLMFLVCYLSIMICYPVTEEGAMIMESTNWVHRASSEDGGTAFEDVAEADAYWDWLDRVIVENLWEKPTLLQFNTILSGVFLTQRKTNFSALCDPLENALFTVCPRWPTPDAVVATANEGLNAILPQISPLVPADLRNTEFVELPLNRFDADTGKRVAVAKATVKSQVAQLRARNWIDGGTAETSVFMVLYNGNTKLWGTLQIRFLVRHTGGLQRDILTQSFLLNPLSDDVLESNAAPWQFRVTLEIIFALSMLLFFIKEVMDISLAIGAGVARAKAHGRGACNGALKGIGAYFSDFWNWLDLALVALGGLVIALQLQIYIALKETREHVSDAIPSGGQFDGDITVAYFMRVANMMALFQIANTMCMILAVFRMFKHLSFHPRLGVVSRTISRAMPSLLHFAIVVSLFVLGYAAVGFAMFSQRSTQFSTLGSSVGTLTRMMISGVDYSEFLGWMPSIHYSWWAYIPLTVYYFGFLAMGVLLMLNILLGIVIATYDVVGEEAEKGSESGTVVADARAGLRALATTLGLGRKPLAASKVDPMTSMLTSEDSELVRPSLATIFNELSTVRSMLVDHRAGAALSLPYRAVEAGPPVKVVFSFADLSQIFSDKVGLYLWAKYGPGNVKSNDETAKTSAEAETSATHVAELLLVNSRLEDRISDMDAKLNVLIATLAGLGGQATLVQQPSSKLRIKRDCAELALPWETVKRVRKERGIIQFQTMVSVDGDSGSKQVIRVWKRATPDELQKARQKRAL